MFLLKKQEKAQQIIPIVKLKDVQFKYLAKKRQMNEDIFCYFFYFYSNCVVSSLLKRCFELRTKEVGAEWESGNNAFRRHSDRPGFCQGNDAMMMMMTMIMMMMTITTVE